MPLFSKIFSFIFFCPVQSFVVGSALLLFSGCSQPQPGNYEALNRWMQESGKLKVLSTTAMSDELVRAVGGERVDHIALIGANLDPHTYELVKGDEEKFTLANVVFYNGLGLEHGASLSYRLKVHSAAFPVGERVQPDILVRHKGQIDPHIWMDISLWAEAAREVARLLALVDPDGAALYRQRGEEVFGELLKAHEEVRLSLQEIPMALRYLVTSHDAFFYFSRAYLAEAKEQRGEGWRGRCCAPEGLAPDGQLSSKHLSNVICFVKAHRMHVVFPESNVNTDSLKKIVECCTAEGFLLRLSQETLYADAMGAPGSDGDTYVKMVKHNAEVIKKELCTQ